TSLPSSWRSRFSSRILSENGRRASRWPRFSNAGKLATWYFAPPTSSVARVWNESFTRASLGFGAESIISAPFMALSAHRPSAAAGIVPRLTAYVLDLVLLAVALLALQGGAYAARGALVFEPHGSLQWELFLLATVSLPSWCYFAFSECSARQ